MPGFVTDWRDHLAVFEGAPGGERLALLVNGADHFLIGGQGSTGQAFDLAARTGLDFLDAHVLGDAAARARLVALTSGEAYEVRRR